MTAAIFVASVPPYFAVLHEACPAGLCAGGQLSPGGMRALDDLGLSIGAYVLALDFLVAIEFCAAGTFVFLQGRGRRPLFVSFALVLWYNAGARFMLYATMATVPGYSGLGSVTVDSTPNFGNLHTSTRSGEETVQMVADAVSDASW